MAARKLKISDNDVQLYLLGELEGDKAEYISRINSLSNSDLKSKMDKDIKSTLTKITNVDNMLQMAADTSYSMPADLESRISSVLASKASVQKKTSFSLADKIKNYFSASNMWSLAGGGAAASLGMLTIIQIQPGLLIDYNSLRTNEPVFRGAAEITSRVSDTCGVLEDEAWIVTDEFMVQIPVCSASEKPISLSNKTTVNIGDEFSIYILPIKGTTLTVSYQSQGSEDVVLVDKKVVRPGILFKLPDESVIEESGYAFSEPKGQDAIRFSTNSGYEYSVQFTVR